MSICYVNGLYLTGDIYLVLYLLKTFKHRRNDLRFLNLGKPGDISSLLNLVSLYKNESSSGLYLLIEQYGIHLSYVCCYKYK